jgi:hypothetical protein
MTVQCPEVTVFSSEMTVRGLRVKWQIGFRVLGALKLGATGAFSCSALHQFAFPGERVTDNDRQVSEPRPPVQRFVDLRRVCDYLGRIALATGCTFDLEVNT